jgi:glutamate/aspartate transport system permease protein
MNYTWDWSVLIQSPYLGWLASGVGQTLAASAGSWILAMIVGFLVGALRSLPYWWTSVVARVYVEVFRNIPPLVQLFLWFFVFPEIVPEPLGDWIKGQMPMPELTTTIVAIGLFAGSRVAEQVRAGVDTVRVRLMPAALATGLTPLQAYRLVLFPIALRKIVAPLTSELLITIKLSSIGLTIGLMELTAQSRQIENYTFHGFEAYAFATAVYLVIGLLVTGIMHIVNRRLTGSLAGKDR